VRPFELCVQQAFSEIELSPRGTPPIYAKCKTTVSPTARFPGIDQMLLAIAFTKGKISANFSRPFLGD
jgi:hypothetical protein